MSAGARRPARTRQPGAFGVTPSRGCSRALAGAAPRGRGWCSRSRSCSALGGGGARAAPAARPRRRARFVVELEPRLPRDAELLRALRRRADRGARHGRPAAARAEPRHRAPLGLEGCLSGNVPAAALAAEGGATGPAAQLARAQHGQGRVRPGHVHQRGRRRRSTNSSRAQTRAGRSRRPSRPNASSPARRSRAGSAPREARRARAPGAQGHDRRASQESLATLALQYGLTAPPEPRRHELRLDARVRLDQARGHAQAALRLPVPEPRRGARLGAHARRALSEAQRTRTIAPDPRSGRDAASGSLAARRALPRHRRAGDRRRPDAARSRSSIELLLVAVLLVMAATLGAGLPRPPAAAAARARAARGGAHVRRAVARRRVADDGLGRRAAGAGRPRRRLRDPVPVARRGGARGRRRAARPRRRASRARRRGAARPTIATAAAASAAAMLVLLLSPVPMVRGFGVLLVVGVAIALRVRAHGRRGGARAAPAARAARGAAPAGAARARARSARSRALAAGLARRARAAARQRRSTRCVARASRSAARCAARAGARASASRSRRSAGGSTRRRSVETDITKLVPQSLGSLQRPRRARAHDRRRRRDRPAGQRRATSPRPRRSNG